MTAPHPTQLAFAEGAKHGAEMERERNLATLDEVMREAWEEGGYGRMDECNILDALIDDIDKRFKQRLKAQKNGK